jgi:hypothetical protein
MKSPAELSFESRVHSCRSHRVLGKKLHPLCLLDILALESIGSPIFAGQPVTPYDLARAVKLLSRKHRDLSVDASFTIPSTLDLLRLRFCSFEDELQKFNDFAADYLTSAEMRRDTSGSKTEPLGSHWIQTLAAFLLRETNLTQREIWLDPIGQILLTSYAVEEQVSQSRIMTEEAAKKHQAAEDAAPAFEATKAKEIQTLYRKLADSTVTAQDRAQYQRRLEKLTGDGLS